MIFSGPTALVVALHDGESDHSPKGSAGVPSGRRYTSGRSEYSLLTLLCGEVEL